MRLVPLKNFALSLAFAGTIFVLLPSQAFAVSGDVNCPDFGTRERAQFEMDKHSADIYGLDGDRDGQACEWNGSTGWWSWPMASVALVAGRLIARKKKADHRVVPGVEGLWNNYVFHEDGGVDKRIDRSIFVFVAIGCAALPITNFLRDYFFPRSFTPVVINVSAAILLGAGSFCISWYANKIDEYR
jgi:hypothetical protein